MIAIDKRRRWSSLFAFALLSTAHLRMTLAGRTIVVDAAGRGDCRTVQEAIERVPDHDAARTVVRIKPGQYEGQFFVPSTKENVTFEGEGVDNTILNYSLNVNDPRPANVSSEYRGAGTVILANDFIAENLTFRNSSGDHGQAMALRIDGDRATVRHCHLVGWQDTLLVQNGRMYFFDDWIAGRVDFIYGSATAVFDRCEIHSRNGGHITAASTPQNHPFGFIFMSCLLTGDPTPWKDESADEQATQPLHLTPTADLGRPWRPYASVTWLNCQMGDHIRSAGWDNWREPSNEKTARYAEFNSTGPGADPSRRVGWARQLTADEAAKVTISSVLSGGDGWTPAAATMPEIVPPQIPDRTFTITDQGALPDGITLCTDAIQKCINRCNAAGGGTVVVPRGTFITGPLQLTSNLNLSISPGATLLISDDKKLFAKHGKNFENCILATDCHDIRISGSGTIDGQGAAWWTEFLKVKNSPAGAAGADHRPYLLVFEKCQRVRIEGVTLQNSPSFHLVPNSCTDVAIDSVHIHAPASSPNTDGIDPSGRNVLIKQCEFDTGDDCIAVKPGGDANSDQFSCENFLITDCMFRHGHGMSVGSQTSGGLRNMIVRDCVFDGTDAGIRLKASRGNAGIVEDLRYENIAMKNVKTPILITSYYPRIPDDPADDPAQALTDRTPVWRHIRIDHLTSIDSPAAGRIIGLPECAVEDVVLNDVHFSAEKGLQIVHAKSFHLINSTLDVHLGKPIDALDAAVQY